MPAEVLLGTQGWSYPDWLGSFYPPGTKSSDFLRIYSQVFRTVELDTTFYGVPRPATVAGWRKNTPDTFRFAAKMPRLITHDKRLVDVRRDVEEFVAVVGQLEERLGPILAQFPPDFHRADVEQANLERFLDELPAGSAYAVEFRHRSWLEPKVYELLRERGIAWAVIDLHYMPRVLEQTADFTYLRWLGDRRAIERYDRIQIDRDAEDREWAETLKELSTKVRRLYGYYNNHYAGHSPESVRSMQRRLGLDESPRPARGLFDDL
ncbi:MAG: DUF72 domain-containing protein [Chloroflexi bacterium]|nr:DUF72 domain-containing protein [Chloroflexota bacterium]